MAQPLQSESAIASLPMAEVAALRRWLACLGTSTGRFLWEAHCHVTLLGRMKNTACLLRNLLQPGWKRCVFILDMVRTARNLGLCYLVLPNVEGTSLDLITEDSAFCFPLCLHLNTPGQSFFSVSLLPLSLCYYPSSKVLFHSSCKNGLLPHPFCNKFILVKRPDEVS